LRYAIDERWTGKPHVIDDAFLDAFRKPMPGGTPFVFDFVIYKNETGGWVKLTRNGSVGRSVLLPDAPEWLEGKARGGWGAKLDGNGRTVSSNSRLALLGHSKATSSLDIWIERIESASEG